MRQKALTLVWVSLLALCNARLASAANTLLDFTNSTPTFNGDTDFSNLQNNNNLVIRWGSIANVGGTNVDLVATVTGGSYQANNFNPQPGFDGRVYLNGLSGLTAANFRFGRINLRNNFSATFTFTLVHPNDNDNAVFADFDFSVLDLDTDSDERVTPASGIESVQLLSRNGTATWTATSATELSSTYQATTPAADWSTPVITATQPFFGATTPGTGADNPTDPLDLTPLTGGVDADPPFPTPSPSPSPSPTPPIPTVTPSQTPGDFESVCNHPCASRVRLVRNPARLDMLYLLAGFYPEEPYDAVLCDFRISLSNVNGPIYDGSLLPGDLVRKGRKNLFRDRLARTSPSARDGISLTQMSRRPEGYWRFQFRAFDDLDAATETEMTLRMETCGNTYELTTDWNKIQNGFKLNMRTIP